MSHSLQSGRMSHVFITGPEVENCLSLTIVGVGHDLETRLYRLRLVKVRNLDGPIMLTI